MRETQCGSVDDLAAAAMRTGWRVKSVGATGARWVCQVCDESIPNESGFRDRPTPTS
jgi:hypothetical protein